LRLWLGLVLIILAVMVGCAPGYYAKSPAYPAETRTYRDTGMLQNPETDSEQDNRIWREESGR
jgi:hypothetical protein